MSPGELIRSHREKKGLSQKALAQALEVSSSFLNDLEHDRRTLPRERAEAICTFLGLTPKERTALYQSCGYLPLETEKRVLADPRLW